MNNQKRISTIGNNKIYKKKTKLRYFILKTLFMKKINNQLQK